MLLQGVAATLEALDKADIASGTTYLVELKFTAEQATAHRRSGPMHPQHRRRISVREI
jgi:hypothetical protein